MLEMSIRVCQGFSPSFFAAGAVQVESTGLSRHWVDSGEPVADPPEIERAIRDFQQGRDRDRSFQLVYRAYLRPVGGFFRRRGFTTDLADDLTQDTFVRVYRHLEAYEHRGNFAAWLFTVAENVCQGEWQRRGTQKRRGIEVSYDEGMGPSDRESGEKDDGRWASPRLQEAPAQEKQLYDRQRRALLDDAIRKLARRQRQCLTLRLRGHSYREIASLLLLTPETVKQHLMVGRKHLRGHLEGLDLADLDQAAS